MVRRGPVNVIRKLAGWLGLLRLPFHSVGVLPYVLGGVIYSRLEGRFRWPVFWWGTFGVVLVMAATYLAGEYWDYREDSISQKLGRSRFAGGSGVLQTGLIRPQWVLWSSVACVALALAVGTFLVIAYEVGAWALVLGIAGLVAGFFYSARPIRWVRTGWGELWIAFCYGWLPIATGFYLQANSIASIVHWVAAPIGLTIFNVILLNEFPDYPADRATGKANLLVRLGPDRAALLYVVVSVGSWGTMLIAVAQGVPLPALWLYLPVFALSLTLAVLVGKGRWRQRRALERLCGANLLVNLGTTLVCVAAYTV